MASARPLPTHHYFRNLDGVATFHEELLPHTARMHVEVELISRSSLGGTDLSTVRIRGFSENRCVCEIRSSFGLFPAEALREQAGVPISAEQRARITMAHDFSVDLKPRPAKFFAGAPRLAGPMLCMLDRVTALDPNGGPAGLGWIRAEKDINADDWIFKSHFFQDPVQPGSLGLEALLQLLQVFMIERGIGADVPHPRFEPVALGKQLSWKYRGQVLPENRSVVTEIEVMEIACDQQGPFVIGRGWLWVDGACVYQATDLGMRIVSGNGANPVPALSA
jgi:3-hydroxymyristoyl/3-hydroxydecanoyl-(acyl carrier protein) dehydratase